MILVIVGTERFPFDRLVAEIDSLKSKGFLGDDVYIQLGPSRYRPTHCSWTRSLPFNEIVEKIKAAEFVITHAGAGTTLLCLHLNRRPILVTRRKQFGEHVDDHQTQLAAKMQKLDWADVAYDVRDLQRVIEDRQSNEKSYKEKTVDNSALVAYLDKLTTTWSQPMRK